MKVLLIITKLILNGDIKYYLVLLYIKLGMTINKHNVLKNNFNYYQIYKEHKIKKNTLNIVKTTKNELNLKVRTL